MQQPSRDTELLTDAAEILAQLSPSRRGLQAAMLEAGVVPPLLRLLASYMEHPQPSAAPPPQQHREREQPLWASPPPPPPQAGQPYTGVGAAGISVGDDVAYAAVGGDGDAGCADDCAGAEGPVGPEGVGARAADCMTMGGGGAVSGVTVDERCGPTGRLAPAAMACVLRTLVNLTSDPRTGGPVRQALLRDGPALAAVMRLLSVDELAGELMEVPAPRGGQQAEAERLGQGATWAQQATLRRGAPANGADQEGHEQREAAAWQVSGLAAWLLAHLSNAPSGQCRLTQPEGGAVPLLVCLVRHGRLAWDGTGGGGGGVAGGATGAAGAGVLLYILSAVQYALMALVNITYDNTATQRVAALAGALEELDALFAALLRPGLLRPPPVPTCGSPAPPALRGLYTGVAKFAVWLLAHLSSSDPGLKAAIAGPVFAFPPKLLAFLLAPPAPHGPDATELPMQHQQGGEAQQEDEEVERRQWRSPAATAATPAAGPSDTVSHGVAAASSRGPFSPEPPPSIPPFAWDPSLVVVQQHAAMALVNLTCGAPAAKAAVAAAVDWRAMAALLAALAQEHAPPPEEDAAEAEAAEAEAAEAEAETLRPPPQQQQPLLTAELLLYAVWLVQHLSLCPSAAAATDPRVVSPLVALLAAPDPRVRLRAAAALGELCSSPDPIRGRSASQEEHPNPGSFESSGAPTSFSPSPAAHPHRAAFHAAGGIPRLLTVAWQERDPQLVAYQALCLSAAVGEGDAAAVAAAVGGGALGLLEWLLDCPHAACLVPAAEALQALARAAHPASSSRPSSSSSSASASAFAPSIAAAAADHVPRSLLARVVAVMLTHGDPRVRAALNEALGAVTALPGVRERYCTVFAETLRDLISASEVELRVIPVV